MAADHSHPSSTRGVAPPPLSIYHSSTHNSHHYSHHNKPSIYSHPQLLTPPQRPLNHLERARTEGSLTHSTPSIWPRTTSTSEAKPDFVTHRPLYSAVSPPSSRASNGSSYTGAKMAVNNAMRNHATAALAEFVGTFLFLFFGFTGAQIVTSAPVSPGTSILIVNLLYISMVFGFSLMVNVFVFYRISGGQFNPAVSLALTIVGAIPPLRAACVVVAQLLGGIAAAAVSSGLFPTPLAIETKLGGGTTPTQGVFIEMFLTAELIIVILFLAVEKHRMTYLAPLGIGFALFVAHLAGVYFTGASLNPARSLGPAVVNGSFPNYHWIYWIGPILGALLASGFYKLLTFCQWKEVNPGQDWDGLEKIEAQRDEGVSEPLVRSSNV